MTTDPQSRPDHETDPDLAVGCLMACGRNIASSHADRGTDLARRVRVFAAGLAPLAELAYVGRTGR